MYLTLNKWYPSIDEYKVVEMARTDDKGETVMKVEVEDVDYRVGVYNQNGTLVYMASPIRLVCIESPCTYALTIPSDADDLYDDWQNLQTGLTFNITTGIIQLIYNDPSQDTSEIKLEVWRETGVSSVLICNDSASSYTAVLTCNVSGYSGQLRAMGYRTASPEQPIISEIFSMTSEILTQDVGLFMTFMITLLLVLMGIISPILAVIFAVIAFIPAVVFGIVPLQIVMLLAAMGFLVIHMMRRSKF